MEVNPQCPTTPSPLRSSSHDESTDSDHLQTPTTATTRPQVAASSSSPLPQPPSSVNIRLWRPAAQRNLRNQWSNLACLRKKWNTCSSTARSHATSLVNSYLSQRYVNGMELGVLKDMTGIREKACRKLYKQQELYKRKLVSSYKDMVTVVTHMTNTSRSMRCYLKSTNSSSLAQFSHLPENEDDSGDGGGIPVFKFWSVACFEKVADEFVRMFVSELKLKRLLIVDLLCIRHGNVQGSKEFCWSNEIYPGEFIDLSTCDLYPGEAFNQAPSTFKFTNISNANYNHQRDHDVLQVYLTTWLAEVSIDRGRVDEIFSEVGEELHVAIH